MAFQTRIKVRFGDEDHAGIVYFPRFLHFFHCAFEDFFDEQGHPYRRCLDEDRVGWPAVHVETDFRSPLRFGDVLHVTVTVASLGRRSATFRYVGRRGDADGPLVAEARITVVAVGMDDFRPRPIPPRYRRLFEAHMEDASTS